ncbi:MAG: hypothetical protein IJL32_15340 [Oscillospiraceae bacterium]|nr:hypothetical protein [Oscillospiraceae bacterium]
MPIEMQYINASPVMYYYHFYAKRAVRASGVLTEAVPVFRKRRGVAAIRCFFYEFPVPYHKENPFLCLHFT